MRGEQEEECARCLPACELGSACTRRLVAGSQWSAFVLARQIQISQSSGRLASSEGQGEGEGAASKQTQTEAGQPRSASARMEVQMCGQCRSVSSDCTRATDRSTRGLAARLQLVMLRSIQVHWTVILLRWRWWTLLRLAWWCTRAFGLLRAG